MWILSIFTYLSQLTYIEVVTMNLFHQLVPGNLYSMFTGKLKELSEDIDQEIECDYEEYADSTEEKIKLPLGNNLILEIDSKLYKPTANYFNPVKVCQSLGCYNYALSQMGALMCESYKEQLMSFLSFIGKAYSEYYQFDVDQDEDMCSFTFHNGKTRHCFSVSLIPS